MARCRRTRQSTEILQCYCVSRAFVPRPVYAVLMLFPITDAYETARKERDELVKSDGSESGIMFFKQTIGNACGQYPDQYVFGWSLA